MAEEVPSITYEDLAAIEDEFEQIDIEIIRKQYELSKPAYAKRAAAVSKLPTFWPLVFEQAPPEIDQYIQPQDSHILNDHLLRLEVTRPEIAQGSPRSVTITFEFSPNEHFSDTKLAKTFWYRRTSDGWTGLVSEPVKVHWNKGKDLSEGLTDAAVELWEARRKVGDMGAKGVPEYKALAKRCEGGMEGNTSFFSWFAWVGSRRWVSAEESEEANKVKEAAREGKRDEKENAEEEEEDEEEEFDEAIEVHPGGEELAVSIAEELWPNAIRFFTQAQEMDDAEMSELDFEEVDDEDAEEGDGEIVDIRSLVQGKEKGRSRDSTGSAAPPSKKLKK